tara:strand:+ start:785 stop:2686 length:1902 start_codon:yes stop_codon:yes gene_type:complete
MASTDKRLNVTELDFDDIKTNLKTFMRNQDEFTDYDFEGSGINALMDLLAYNTHYLAMNVNMAANEMFLDTASVRASVVSHAKTLGYTPNSARAPIGTINVSLNNFPSTLTTATIPAETVFTSTVDDVSYQFVTISEVTTPVANGILSFSNIPIYEGTYTKNRYTVDVKNVDQKFKLTSDRADTTTLKVQVFDSASSSNFATYTLATDITQVSSTSNVYFLQECGDGRFEIYFGDGIVGRALSDNNVVVLSYVVTNKTKANGATNFRTTATISGITDVTTTTVSVASGGAEPESIQSIKLNAPLDYAAQGRAVTPEDYKTIIPKVYANTKSVQVWGGEDNSTPVYGRTYISIVPTAGSITAAAKEQIVKDLKGTYAIASVTPVIVDSVTTFVRLGVNFKFNKKNTTKTSETLISNVTKSLQNYDTENLQKFDGVFRHSQVTGLIDDTDDSILSNITTVKLSQFITPSLNVNTKYTLEFNNAIYNPHTGHAAAEGGVLSSTGFKISGNSNEMFLNDDGQGVVRMFYYTDGTTITYQDETAGTINYKTGVIELTALNITSISSVDGASSSKIRIVVTPDSTDVVAVRNQILEIDFANTTVESSEDTIAGGGASAGVGYTTTSSYTPTTSSTSSGY